MKTVFRFIFIAFCVVPLIAFGAPKSNVIGWYCSSFFINSQGYIATASHCVKNSTSLTVLYNGTKYPAKLHSVDYVNDVAIIEIAATNTPHYNMSLFPGKDNKVYILGYPLPQERGFNLKIKSGYVVTENDREYTLAGGTCEGNSGGPVVNTSNDAIGVLIEGIGSSPCAYFVNASRIIHVITLAINSGVSIVVNLPNIVYSQNTVYNEDIDKTPFLIGTGTE